MTFLRAWAPVHDSIATVVGAELFEYFYGSDWRAHEERDVRPACSDYLVWVAEIDGRVVGFTAVDTSSHEVEREIYMLAVDPEHQRRGVGLDLTDFAVEQIGKAGKKVAVLETGGDPGHAAARATYTKAGFTALPIERYKQL